MNNYGSVDWWIFSRLLPLGTRFTPIILQYNRRNGTVRVLDLNNLLSK